MRRVVNAKYRSHQFRVYIFYMVISNPFSQVFKFPVWWIGKSVWLRMTAVIGVQRSASKCWKYALFQVVLNRRFAFYFHSPKNDAIINNTSEFFKLEILSLISYLVYITITFDSGVGTCFFFQSFLILVLPSHCFVGERVSSLSLLVVSFHASFQ